MMTTKKKSKQEALLGFIDNVKGVYFVMAILIAAGSWVYKTAHAEYMTLSNHANIQTHSEIRAIKRQIVQLDIRLLHTTENQPRLSIKAQIIQYKDDINELENEQ